jgi:hypothetical protein
MPHTRLQNTLVPDQLSRKSLWLCTSMYATWTSGSSHVHFPQGIKPKLALKRKSAITLVWTYYFRWLAADTITPECEDLNAVTSKFTVFLTMTSWCPIEIYRNFGRTRISHLRDRQQKFRNKVPSHYSGEIIHPGFRPYISPNFR